MPIDDESSSPIPIPRRTASVESSSLANLGAAFNAVALHCGEDARDVDGLRGRERAARLRETAAFLAQVRDLTDDTVTAILALADEAEAEG